MASITDPALGFSADVRLELGAGQPERASGASSRAFAFFLRFVPSESEAARLEVDAVLGKRLGALGAGLFVAVGLTGLAYADCGSDMQKLAQERNTQLEIVNNFAKAFHGKPLDPEAFCAQIGRSHPC